MAPRVLSCILGAVVCLGSPVAGAASDTVSSYRESSHRESSHRESSHRDLETRSKLDLDRLWHVYQRKGETRPFEQFVEAKYRHQRDVGRGLLVGGASLGVVAAAMFFLALPRNDAAAFTYTSYGLMGATAGLMIVGGVLWRKNYLRLERLESAGLALGPRGRVQLRSAGPVALPRGAGISFGLAF